MDLDSLRRAARGRGCSQQQLGLRVVGGEIWCGIGALPVPFAERESDLVAVIGPLRELTYPFYLLMHQDVRRTPRVRAFFDFVIAEIKTVRLALSGDAKRPKQ